MFLPVARVFIHEAKANVSVESYLSSKVHFEFSSESKNMTFHTGNKSDNRPSLKKFGLKNLLRLVAPPSGGE